MNRLLPIALLALLVGSGCAASKDHIRRTEEQGRNLRIDLAETYVQRGAYDAALPLLKRAIVENPHDPRPRVLYATILRQRGLYPQAEMQYGLAIKVAPQNADAHAGIGVLFDLMRRPIEAQRAHKRALKLAPGNATYWNNYGFSLLTSGHTKKAIPCFERALHLDPGLVIAYNNLGFAYGRSGDDNAAERSFRSGLGEASAQLNMSLVYEERGDAARANTARQRAYQLDPKLQEN